jgi:hypothetical protein
MSNDIKKREIQSLLSAIETFKTTPEETLEYVKEELKKLTNK